MLENNTYSIAVDSGKYDTKYAMSTEGAPLRGKFRTKASEFVTDSMSASDTTHIIEFEGKKYVVGDQANDDSVSFDTSKKLLVHKLATYTAIGSLVKDNSFVNLGIGCPLRVFHNDEDRKEYEQFFYPEDGFVTLVIDGKEKHFSIAKVKSYAESSGVIALNIGKYLTKTVGVIDIGGLNMNACVYKNGFPLLDTSISEELGGNVLQQSVKTAFQTTFNSPLRDYLMPTILKDGYSGSKNIEKQKEIVKKTKVKHVQKILDECVRLQWPLDFMNIVFCGGASVYLKDELMEQFEVGGECFVDDAAYSNVLGFLKRLQ